MTLHIYDDMEQRSDQWYAARCGIVTASVVGKLLTVGPPDPHTVECPACGVKAGPCLSVAQRKTPALLKKHHGVRADRANSEPPVIAVADNDTSRGVTATLVAERIAGWTDPTRMTDDMWHGVEAEPIARDIYSGHYQQAVEVGFMRLDEDGWTLGLSPDGLVGTDGGVEIKAPRTKTHVLWTLADRVPPQHMAQVQAALLVTGRDWWDFVSYVGGLPLFVKRVYPDPAWHEAIVAACRKFETTAAEMVAAYEQATTDMPATERIPDYEMSL